MQEVVDLLLTSFFQMYSEDASFSKLIGSAPKSLLSKHRQLAMDPIRSKIL